MVEDATEALAKCSLIHADAIDTGSLWASELAAYFVGNFVDKARDKAHDNDIAFALLKPVSASHRLSCQSGMNWLLAPLCGVGYSKKKEGAPLNGYTELLSPGGRQAAPETGVTQQ